MHVDSIEIMKNLVTTGVQCDEFKLFTINNTGAYYCCIRAEDISNYKIFIKQIDFEIGETDDNRIEKSFNFLEQITIFWSTNFHLKAFLLIKDMSEFLTEIKEELDLKPKSPSTETNQIINFRIFGNFAFYIKISDNYSAQVSFGK